MNFENEACNCCWLVRLSIQEEGKRRSPGEL
jgi:hypothetical protein